MMVLVMMIMIIMIVIMMTLIGTVVSVRACEHRIPVSITRYLLATFHSLVLPPRGQRLPKLLS